MSNSDLANLRLYELRELAREQGIAGFSKARKAQLVEALENGYQHVQGGTSGSRSGNVGQARQSYNSDHTSAYRYGQGSRERVGQSYSGNRYSDYSSNYGNVGQSNDYDSNYRYGNYASTFNYGSRVGQSNYGSRGRTGYGSRGRF